MISSVNIPRVPYYVKAEQVERAFTDTFGEGCVKNIDSLPKKDKAGRDFQMLFVHFEQENPSEELIDYSKRIDAGEPFWLYYDNKGHYFMTRKIKVKTTQKRLITQADMEEIKKNRAKAIAENAAEDASEDGSEETQPDENEA
jgi:hypothetical protein